VDARVRMEDAPESAKREEAGTVLTFSAILPSVVVGSSVFECSLGRAAGGVPGFSTTSGITAAGTTGGGAAGVGGVEAGATGVGGAGVGHRRL
jgi:hypothetical protein